MKSLLAALFLSIATAIACASEPGTPPETKGIEGAIAAADVVVIGTPSKVDQRHFYKGKEVTEQEARKIFDSYDSDSGEPFPRLETEFTVTLRVSTHLKGALRNPELVLQWRDLTGSMCPHIPLIALRDEGIWYTGSHVKQREHDHAVYWVSSSSKVQAEAALAQPAEQGGAGQPATRAESE
ncbi:MAG: hypothetical protein ACSHYF_15595 [Verrucomicrobiaceae bacterium]